MIKKIIIREKKIKTEIIIKNNFIKKYLNKLLVTDKKIYCIIDNNVKHLISNFEKKENLLFSRIF